jgi:phosphate transport system substrate-binding protein
MPVRSLLFTLAALIAVATPASADVLRLHGSTTVFANILQPHQQAIESRSGHNLRVVSNGSGRGLQDLVGGRADIGMISAPLETTVKKIKKKNAAFDDRGLTAHQVGETKVAFITHPSNPVRSLTLKQVTAILEGKITNWQEVGGRPQPIVIVCEDRNGGLRAMTEKALLEGKSIVGSAKQIPNGTQIPKIVAQMPVAFGVAAAAAVGNKVREVSTDESIAQPLILVTRGEATPAQRAVIDAARAAGS